MFRSALVKLTLICVALAAGFSIGFSIVFYHFAANELCEGLQHQYEAFQDNDHNMDTKDGADITSTAEIHARETDIVHDLIYLDVTVIAGSVIAGYFLARRTLRPIEEAHRSQIRFTAEASHELKTPLTAMKADTESVLMQRQPSAKQLRHTLERNLEDIGRLESLTMHLLDMGRYRSGVKAQLQAVDLAETISKVIRQLDLKYADKHLVITHDIPTISFQADPLAIEQLLVILMDNACKYSTDEGTVLVRAYTEGKQLVITVSDKGIGIPEADLPHVFEYFYRSSHTLAAKKASGYGLGLPLAQDIVRTYKGSIALDSGPKRGTIATVKLPLKTGWRHR